MTRQPSIGVVGKMPESVTISVKVPEAVFEELRLRVPEGQRSDFIRDAIVEKLDRAPKPDRIAELEQRMEKFENSLYEMKKALAQLEILTYESGEKDLYTFCVDEQDRRIVDYLVQKRGATTTNIAEAIGMARREVLNRLQKIQSRSRRELGKSVVSFYPGLREGKMRAWWIEEKVE
jgi:Arc/MetJ-type ribon-helix-helix transcriptional regulator